MVRFRDKMDTGRLLTCCIRPEVLSRFQILNLRYGQVQEEIARSNVKDYIAFPFGLPEDSEFSWVIYRQAERRDVVLIELLPSRTRAFEDQAHPGDRSGTGGDLEKGSAGPAG